MPPGHHPGRRPSHRQLQRARQRHSHLHTQRGGGQEVPGGACVRDVRACTELYKALCVRTVSCTRTASCQGSSRWGVCKGCACVYGAVQGVMRVYGVVHACGVLPRKFQVGCSGCGAGCGAGGVCMHTQLCRGEKVFAQQDVSPGNGGLRDTCQVEGRAFGDTTAAPVAV